MGHENGGWMNEDQRNAEREEAAWRRKTTSPPTTTWEEMPPESGFRCNNCGWHGTYLSADFH